MYKLLREKNEAVRDELLQFAQAMVRTPSPSLNEAKVADLVEAKLRELQFDKVLRDETGNVLGVMIGRAADPTVLLASHMDTASAGNATAWREYPCGGEIGDGRLHGLGASDCKGGLAAQVYAADLLQRSLLPFQGNLIVAATVSEELGGSPGVRALLEKTLPELGMKPTYAILGEPTGLDLYYGHDGWIDIEVRVEGSNPFQVDDAARAVFRELDAQYRAQGAEPEALALDEPRYEEIGGVRRATIRMNRRLRATDEVVEVISQVKRQATQVANGTGSVAVDVMVREEEEKLYNGAATVIRRVVNAWETNPFSALMDHARQALTAAGCAAKPGKWTLGRLGMGTAGSVFVKEFGIPTIGYGPGTEAAAHAANESVETDAVVRAAYGTAAIVHSLIGIPVWGWTADEI